MNTRRARRLLTSGIAVMSLGALLAVPLVVAAQEASDFRTAVDGLSGYSGLGEGSPMSVQFFNATGGTLPTDPGEPEFEATEAYSRSVLGTGPQARATASSAWPGPAFGDGFGTICGCGESYFIKADAVYPEGPYEDDQSAPEANSGMRAQAFGLDVYAQASSTNSPNESGGGFGNAASETTATVTDEGVMVTTTDSAVQDVNIGNGVITIDSVRTVMTATSDGAAATTEGTTIVSGFQFLGVPFTVDENGVRPGGEDTLVPPPGNVTTPEEMGITIALAEHEPSVNGASGERFAGGLVITFNASSFAEGVEAFENQSGQDSPVNPLSPPQTGIDDDLDGAIAQAYVSALFPFLTSSADVRYIYARGKVKAAASPPFTMPDFPQPDFNPPPSATQPQPPPSTGGTFTPPTFGTVAPPAPVIDQQPPSQVAAPQQPVLAAAPELPDWFNGLPFVLFLMGAMVTGIGGYGLRGLSGAALGSGSSEFCESGAPKRVPSLRAE